MQLTVNAIDFFEKELETAREEVNEKGLISKVSARLPGIVEYRFAQYQEVEAILELLNIRLRKIRGERMRFYMEQYSRALTSRDAEKYADADQSVLDIAELVNFFSFVRNKYMGVIKALDSKSFTMSGIIRLKTAGMEEATIDDSYR